MARFAKTDSDRSIKSSINGGMTLPNGTTAQRNSDPASGEIRYNTSLSSVEYYSGSSWSSLRIAGSSSITKDSFTGDGSTTVYTLSLTPADENNILVFVGNVFQNPDVAYTLSGADIIFSSPPPDTHVIVVLHGFDT